MSSDNILRENNIVRASIIVSRNGRLVRHNADPQSSHKVPSCFTRAISVGILIRLSNDPFVKPAQPFCVSMPQDYLATHIFVIVRGGYLFDNCLRQAR
ncbi:MAG: hypothetical protein WAN65_03630 [Candidatus Sulfotelmatobacter sp.]